LSDSFPVLNGLRQRDTLSPFVFNFALDDTIMKTKERWIGTEWDMSVSGLYWWYLFILAKTYIL